MDVGPWVKNKPSDIGLTPRTKTLWENNAHNRELMDAEPVFIYRLTVKQFLRRTE